MHTVSTTVYKYRELSPGAKEKARQWWIANIDESDYAESVIEDAEQVAVLLGVGMKTKEYKTLSGSVRSIPCVYWSGFCNQGDGASFEGWYRPKAGNYNRVKDYAPQDEMLHGIAQALDEAFDLAGESTHCIITTRGNYSHSGTMQFEFDEIQGEVPPEVVVAAEMLVIGALRSFADWIYRRLQEEYEYQTSEEAVAETMEANEYTFTAGGVRFG